MELITQSHSPRFKEGSIENSYSSSFGTEQKENSLSPS